MKKIIALLIFSGTTAGGFAQQGAYFDPAQAYNRILMERNGDNTYRRIDNYKVSGTPYLFGEKHAGNFYSSTETAKNIYLSYNSFNQQVEFYTTANPDKALIKEPGSLDSFTIRKNLELQITEDLQLIYGPLIGAKDKSYYVVVYRGPKYTLYKKYETTLEVVSTNVIDASRRKFEINYSYWYADSASKSFKALKARYNSVVKEFKSKNLSEVFTEEDMNENPENALASVFAELNK